ncbi:cyclic nucleotide-binding domain-containing protein [Cesiribacter sp. SM1]|uniref:cyclic nucleotide-binding domain-containing protein n=1 Tax=Cesiribacter sp. SM1 TaxID=2861196 RepID=UPI001CD38506|nr:cyclic nucleotide-binding domain-containing protein [Cesiribacter sp. SM1]
MTGEFLFRREDPLKDMFVILDGHVDITLEQNGQPKQLYVLRKGDITGLLPFSRLTTAPLSSSSAS